jgi:pyruvate dehydrogenase E2 component (dihydrolipoamide acetyltransferase)
VDLASLQGTGPEGRILADDVERAASAARTHLRPPSTAAPALPAGEVETVPLTSIRKTIARRLTEAWSAPVFQLGVSADMTEVLALREQLVERLAEGDAKPTVNDVLVKLAGAALMRHLPVNATFTGEEIQRHPSAHVGIAVAAPQGLVVPVIRDADRRTVQEIARRAPTSSAARATTSSRSRTWRRHVHDLEPRDVRRRAVHAPCSTRRRSRSSPSAR